jgi:hypothetical protein
MTSPRTDERERAATGLEPLAREAIAEAIEEAEALDALAEPLQKAVRTVVPQDSPLKDVLSGTWLGHPVHPPLTDVVIGSWTSALLLDLLAPDGAEEAADALVAAGYDARNLAGGLHGWVAARLPLHPDGGVVL